MLWPYTPRVLALSSSCFSLALPNLGTKLSTVQSSFLAPDPCNKRRQGYNEKRSIIYQ